MTDNVPATAELRPRRGPAWRRWTGLSAAVGAAAVLTALTARFAGGSMVAAGLLGVAWAALAIGLLLADNRRWRRLARRAARTQEASSSGRRRPNEPTARRDRRGGHCG